MKEKLLKWATQFNERNVRERVLIAATAWAVIIWLWANILVDPVTEKENRFKVQIGQVQKTLQTLQIQRAEIAARQHADPNKSNREKISALKANMQSIDQQIHEITDDLIPPSRMSVALEELLAASNSIQLESVVSHPAVSIIDYEQTEENAAVIDQLPSIFMHSFTLNFKADYAATLDFIQTLESMSWNFYWDGMHYEVDGYPQANVSITVFTLSLDKQWIGV